MSSRRAQSVRRAESPDRRGRAADGASGLRLLEARLAIRERQLAEVERVAHVGAWQWDLASDEVTWSEETFRIFGFEPGKGEATFPARFDHFVADDRPRARAAVPSHPCVQ